MKIKKQATSRHESTLSSMIADFVKATELIPLFQLPAHLASFPRHWPFPRGDAYHWIPALNRFDHILELFNKEYGLVDGPQTQPFERRLLLKGDAEQGSASAEQTTTDAVLDTLHVARDGDRELIEQILNFTRTLLENCGNRSLYSSSERLDKLLNTTSTSLLKATLRLGHRLAQRYAAARMRLAPATLHPSLLSSHYNINLDKVQKLASPFAKGPATPAPVFGTPAAKGKDRAGSTDRVSPSDLVAMYSLSEASMKQEFGGVLVSYYEPTPSSEAETSKPAATDAPAPTTPTPVRRTSSMGPNRTPRQPQPAPATDSPSTPVFTPGQPSSRTNGPKIFELSAEKVSRTDVHDLIKEGLASLPETVHYEFLHKLRTAKMFHEGRAGRDSAVAVRLLSIANIGYVHIEKEFMAKLGQQDADEPRRLQLAYQLSELVHPPGNGETGISMQLQTYTMSALEALAKHKSKAPDVCTALSVNVNHGVLFYVVRKLVAGLGEETGNPDDIEEDEWRDALFSLLNTLPTSQTRTGEQMVAAGLLEILVDVLQLRTAKAERNHPKILNFLDTFVYNLRDAFSALVAAKGLEIIADLMQYEVDISKKLAEEDKGMPKEYKTQLTDYQIPFYHQQSLRWLFKFLNHMMSHTGGNFDRLMRNLLDSQQLLSSLRTVLSNAKTFGSTVWSMAVTILTSFINNEPTSYQVIAEAGLSDAFLETVAGEPASEAIAAANADVSASTPSTYPPRQGGKPLAEGILPVAEAISTLPPAFDGICLAEAGMKLFQSSTALQRFFEIFESPAHIKALDADTEMPTLIGNSFDELVRHHPPLKSRVLSCLSELIARVVQLCAEKAEKEGVGAKLWCEDAAGKLTVAGGRQALSGSRSQPNAAQASESASTDVEMKDADETANESVAYDQVTETEDSTKGPTTGQYIRVLCRFLSGFFSNHAMCAAYVELDGVDSILDISSLACLDPKAGEYRSMCEQFGHVVQVLVEQKPHIAVPSLIKRTQMALERLQPLLDHTGKQAFFAPFTSSGTWQNTEHLQRGTQYVKALVSAHTLVGAMTLTFQSQMYTTRSAHNVSSQINLADMYARLVDSLGKLHRSCVWEELLLQRNMPTEWEKETRITSSGFGNDEADNVFRIGNSATESPSNGDATASGPTSENTVASQNSARFKNTQTLRNLLSRIPTEVAPFFQSLGKLLLFRRSLEAYQRQCATVVSDQLAQAVIDQLEYEGPKDSEIIEDRYAYWIVILTSLSQLIVEPNLDRSQALTLLLVSFRNLGGFDVLADILNQFYQSALEITQKPAEDTNEKSKRLLNLSLGGIKIILAFFAQIINFKVISESPQTSSMQTRPDRDRERSDYFLTAQFLVELRYAVIVPVEKIWSSDMIDKATTSIVKTSINILKSVLECEGEHGAYKSIDKIPKRSKPIIKPWSARNGDHLPRLKENGHEESLAEEALYRCCDNFNMANEYCKNQARPGASRNPIPQYEIQARGPPSASPSRAEVVVPEHPDDASMTSSEETRDEDGSAHPETQSGQMEDADTSTAESEAPTSTTPVPGDQPSQTPTAPQDALAYQKRMANGNSTQLVALDQLDEQRSKLREKLVEQALDVLNSHEDVTFELADLISAAVLKAPNPPEMRAEIGMMLVQSLMSLQGNDDFRNQSKKIAASAHLLALILQEKDFYDVIVEQLKQHFTTLLGFIKIFPDQSAEDSSPWIGQVLLIVERLLAEDQLPHQIQWTPPTEESTEETTVDELPQPIVSVEEKDSLFNAIIEMLPRIGKDESLALSVTRVLAMLTRTRKIATRLAEKRNVQRLFLMVKQLAGITNEGLRSAFMIVLRHMIEDDEMIRQIMRTEIQQMFESRDRRQTDTTGYTRQMYALAIRAPEIFVEVTNEKLQLKGFDPNQRPQTLMLKKTEPSPADGTSIVESSEITAEADKPKESSEAPKQPFLERTKTSDLKVPVVENPDGVIHYLLCELLAYKEAEDKPEPAKPKESAPEGQASKESSSDAAAATPAAAPAESAKPEKPVFKAEEHPIYIYRCFILKCLAELLQSYNRTKIEFINFSRKADPYTVTPSKPRSGVLNYLLNNVVPIGNLNHEGDLAFKKKLATSNCAIDVIVSLCNKTGEFTLPKTDVPISPYVETEPDLLFVRKFVLEHALKAFKDANASDEPLDMKYSRLLSIADIFSRMVSQRPNGEMLTQNADLTPNLKQMAKIMYEKNFVTILTTAISDIDLNFPNAKRVVKYILKPLKWLCYVAMDLSMHYDTSSAPDSADEYEISTASDDDLIGNEREETPDLFRNSTLGMFEAHESESDEDSEDEEGEEMMYDDPYADDMEYDEGDIGDDDVVSDDDEEILEMDIDGMGPIEGLPGDVDVEIELDDDGNAMGSDDDSEDEDEDDEDDDDDDMDDMDDDGDDGMDDMEEAMDAMEEITGDDENASLAEDQEDDWSDDDQDDFPGGPNGDANMPPGALGFVLDPPQLLEQMRQQGGDLEGFLDDNMEEEDMDEEEEEYDEEIHYDPGMEDDDDAMPEIGWGGGWEDPQPPTVRHTHRLSPWMFPAGPGDRILVPAYRSHRPGAGPRVTDDGINPLLQRGGRSAGRDGLPRNEGNSDWVHAIEGRGPRVFSQNDSPVSFISNLLNAMSSGAGAGGPTLHQHGGALHLSFNNSMGMPPFDSGMRRDIARMRETYTSRTAREDPHSAVSFVKAYTSQRWQEEARILYGPAAIEKSNRVINSILKVMVPPAMEAAKKRLEERQAEVARKLKEEQEQKEQKEREEREKREAQEKEDRERQEREAAEAASRAQEQPAEGEPKMEPETAPEAQAMEGVEGGQSSASAETAGAEPAPAEPAGPPPSRITTMIRGHEYDITDLGIDTEYLDALPEDLREEVLMQQVAERRAEQRAQARRQEQQQQQSQAPAQGQTPAAPEEAGPAGELPTDINADFLAALPAEIREELLAQEAQERRRREREENRRRNQASAGAPAPQAEDMDPASFFASLDPTLRAAVLMDTDEDILRQLPPELSAEARAMGGDRRLHQFNDFGYRRGDRRAQPDDPSQKKKARPCVQMLDKAGVATLLRLMFIPQQGSAKGSLSSILRYVCENRQNRAEVISILLSILQDGSADVNAVEKSFAQLSIRAKQPQQPADKTPKISRKNGALSINADVSPLMVVQQCLNTLTQLTEKNPAVWQFFLTEHETGVGFKNRANRKGKAKETKANRYPVNALLTLLDRKLIVESSTIMEQLTTLLKVITAPLQVLKKEKAAEEAKEAETSAEGQTTENQPADTATTEARPEGQHTEMTTAPENAAQPETVTTEGEGSTSKTDESKAEDEKAKKHRSLTPPDVPEANLRLVAKILAARECNSKVFQETLSVISNLSPIPGAKEIFGQELLGIAKDLASSTLEDLASLTVQVSKASSPTDVQGIALAKFSPASSDQTKLLRALTALDYLFDPSRDNRDKPESAAEALEPAQKEDILLTLYEDRAFAPLWEKLSECLAVIRQRGNMLNIATTLLPLIESLMVVCKNTTLKEMPLSKMLPKEFALSSPPPESRMENLFFNFTEEHRKILNDLVRQNPKLMSGTFSLLVKNSKVLEFDNKRNYFNRKLHARGGDRQAHPPLQLSVRRDQVFLDSFKSLYFKSADEMKFGKLSIRFHGEEGVDAGGVTREWFQSISRQMFNADYALFVPVASDRTTFHPNRLSSINPEHLMFFKFIGRIIGKALYEGRVLDCHFSRAVYKQIMGKQVSLKDMETLDLEYYKSLEWMIHNEITDIITETFSVEVEAFGEMQTVDLIENGRNIPVTEDNKHEYVRLITEHRLVGAVQEQLENFLKGFHDIVPAELVSIFSEQELELLISGLPDINVDDWKNNTEYHNYTAASPQIQWFWRAVRTFEKEEQAKLLQFVTGTSKVPLNGFKELEGMNGFSKFNIHRDYGSKDRLPSSHTCFNQLDLPEYETYEDLRKALYTAMTAGGEYFGFA